VTRSPLAAILDVQDVVVLDGGLATHLEGQGHAMDSHLWSARLLLDDPDAVREAHLAFLDAGADCITTVSYQASAHGFARLGLAESEFEEILRLSVRLAYEARDAWWRTARRVGRARPLVAASVGPYGASLADGSEYRGQYDLTPEALDRFHRKRFEVLAASDADLIAIETIPSLQEVETLLAILRDTPDAWAWLSVTCRDEAHLSDGSAFDDLLALCRNHERLAAVGVNCTAPTHVEPLVRAAVAALEVPVLAYPNAGELYDGHLRSWTGGRDRAGWLAAAETWRAAGARVLGGCCRVGPDVIRNLRRTALG
jgi:homocysteine S-methyltransferase